MTQQQKLALARAAFRLAELEVLHVAAYCAESALPDDATHEERGRLCALKSSLHDPVTEARKHYIAVRRDCGLPEIKP